MAITYIYLFFQESTGNYSSAIPVLSAGGSNNTSTPLPADDQLSVNKMIFVVEKTLKMGLPIFVALFTVSFFAVGFCL